MFLAHASIEMESESEWRIERYFNVQGAGLWLKIGGIDALTLPRV